MTVLPRQKYTYFWREKVKFVALGFFHETHLFLTYTLIHIFFFPTKCVKRREKICGCVCNIYLFFFIVENKCCDFYFSNSNVAIFTFQTWKVKFATLVFNDERKKDDFGLDIFLISLECKHTDYNHCCCIPLRKLTPPHSSLRQRGRKTAPCEHVSVLGRPGGCLLLDKLLLCDFSLR